MVSFQTFDTNGGVGNADYAPDSGTWLYAFTTGVPLQLSVAEFSVPRNVAHGKTFRVTMRVRRSDTGEYVTAEAGGAVSCNAAIGKRRLQPTARGFIRVGDAEVGACSFRAPKNAAHKTIRGSISVSLNGVSTIRPFTVKIR